MEEVPHGMPLQRWALIVIPVAIGFLISSPSSGEEVFGTPGLAVRQAVVDLPGLAPGEGGESGGRKPVPFLPVPQAAPGVPGGAAAEAGGGAAPQAAAAAGDSPPLAASFQALIDDGQTMPPDTNGAVGPDHLMVTLNSQVAFEDRSGATLRVLSLQEFWASLGKPFAFDPRVIHDPYLDRWIFAAGADPESADSGLLLAVSRTADPTGSWNTYRIDVDPMGLAWLDHPRVAFNKKWIVVEGVLYTGAEVFQSCDLFVFDKEALYAGGPGAYQRFKVDPAEGTNPAPAITLDPAASDLDLLQTFNGDFNGRGYYRLYRISGEVAAPALSLGPFIEFPVTWDYSPAGYVDFAPQLGSSWKIQVNVADIEQVVERDQSIWAAHTVFLPAGGSPTSCAVQWLQVSRDGALLQWGRIADPAGKEFYAFPSLAVNRWGDSLLGYSRFSADRFPGAGYSFRFASDPPGTFRAPAVLKDGEAPYSRSEGGGSNRWGDYSSTAVDPRNDADLWTIQEYAAKPSGQKDRWGTWWGQVAPFPPTPFRRGDSSADALLDLTDAVNTLGFLFLADPRSLSCEESADCDGNDRLEISDPVFLLDYLFLAGPEPGAPFPACGQGARDGRLSCAAFPPCGP